MTQLQRTIKNIALAVIQPQPVIVRNTLKIIKDYTETREKNIFKNE